MSNELANCPVCYGWSGSPCGFCGHVRGYRYSVVLADPPWRGENRGNRAAPSYEGKRPAKIYDTVQLEGLIAMGELFAPLIADDAFLFLWAPHILVLDGQAQKVARAWGFTVKQEIVWVKLNVAGDSLSIGMGNYSRVTSEPMLLCRRGKAKVVRHDMPNIILAPRGEHSAKPGESYRYIEALTGADRFLELFARRRYSERWVCHGNQAPRNDTVRMSGSIS